MAPPKSSRPDEPWHLTLTDPRHVAFVSAYVASGGDLDDAAARASIDVETARQWAMRRDVKRAVNARKREVGLCGAVADLEARSLLFSRATATRDKVALIASLHRREEARDMTNAFRELGAGARDMSIEQILSCIEEGGFVFAARSDIRELESVRRARLVQPSSPAITVDAEPHGVASSS